MLLHLLHWRGDRSRVQEDRDAEVDRLLEQVFIQTGDADRVGMRVRRDDAAARLDVVRVAGLCELSLLPLLSYLLLRRLVGVRLGQVAGLLRQCSLCPEQALVPRRILGFAIARRGVDPCVQVESVRNGDLEGDGCAC